MKLSKIVDKVKKYLEKDNLKVSQEEKLLNIIEELENKKSKNENIKEEYNILRKELAEMLIDINTLALLENDSEQLTQLELIKTELVHNDLASSEELDALIRDDKIKATMATSYMNDSATGYSIQKKLVKVANILFLNDGIVKQIGDENETK